MAAALEAEVLNLLLSVRNFVTKCRGKRTPFKIIDTNTFHGAYL